MSKLVVESDDRPALDLSLLVMRLAVGSIMAAHGAQKLFGMFGGKGLKATVAAPPDGMGLIGYLVAVGECIGGLGIMIGLLTRFSAASNFVIMVGAIAIVHGKNGFFLNNGGFEYNLALIGLLLPIVLLGPGKYSISRCCMPKSQSTGRTPLILD